MTHCDTIVDYDSRRFSDHTPISDGQSVGVNPPDVYLVQTPISDSPSEGTMPPENYLDHNPISDGLSESIIPPVINFDHSPISEDQSVCSSPPEINFDHPPLGDGQSVGITPSDVSCDHSPCSDGQSEVSMLPDKFDQTPISDGESEGVDAMSGVHLEVLYDTVRESGSAVLEDLEARTGMNSVAVEQARMQWMELGLMAVEKGRLVLINFD